MHARRPHALRAWRRSGSNRRPPACKAGALPAELRPRPVPSRPTRPARPAGMGQGGLEPPTPRLSSVCSNQLSYWPALWPALGLPCCGHPSRQPPRPALDRAPPDRAPPDREGRADGAGRLRRRKQATTATAGIPSVVPREQRPQGTTDTEIRKPQANSHTHARMRAHTDDGAPRGARTTESGPETSDERAWIDKPNSFEHRRMAEWMVVGRRPTDRLLDRSASQVLSGAAATGRQHRAEPQKAKPCSGGFRLAAAASLKGGDPAAGSPTATLLRLHPSR